MAFEGLDTTPLIDSAGFTPHLAVMPEPEAGTLEAALREATRADRAAVRVEATMLDLWIDRTIGLNLRALERPTHAASASWHNWAMTVDDGGVLDIGRDGPKTMSMSAAFGDEGEEIVVKGTRSKDVDDDDGGDTGGGYGAGSYGDSPGGDIGDGGAGGGTLEEQQQQNDCRDRKAIEARTAINGQPDDHAREYGAILYRGADGRVQMSDLIPGTESQITQADIVNTMTTTGISFDQVIGFVHNHDAWYYGRSNEEADVNRYPSGADWSTANWMVANGAGGSNGDNFALYLIDTAKVMREFEYEDRSTYQNLDRDDKIAGSGLPNATSSDGSSCG